MGDKTSLSTHPRRTRRVVFAALALCAAAGFIFIVLRPLVGSVPMVMSAGWHGWFGTFNGVALITLAGLPVAVLAAWALARYRSSLGATSAWQMSLAEVGIVYGTVPWVWMILLPGAHAGDARHRVHLIPLQDVQAILADGPLAATGQIIGNLLVFAAFGFLAPIRFPALASLPRVVAAAASFSFLLEVVQYVLQLDRVSSVDDVLLNAAGAGLAAWISRRWWRAAPP